MPKGVQEKRTDLVKNKVDMNCGQYTFLDCMCTIIVCIWGGSKGVVNFPGIFYAMRSVVPVGHFRNISGHLFTWRVCGSFQ